MMSTVNVHRLQRRIMSYNTRKKAARGYKAGCACRLDTMCRKNRLAAIFSTFPLLGIGPTALTSKAIALKPFSLLGPLAGLILVAQLLLPLRIQTVPHSPKRLAHSLRRADHWLEHRNRHSAHNSLKRALTSALSTHTHLAQPLTLSPERSYTSIGTAKIVCAAALTFFDRL